MVNHTGDNHLSIKQAKKVVSVQNEVKVIHKGKCCNAEMFKIAQMINLKSESVSFAVVQSLNFLIYSPLMTSINRPAFSTESHLEERKS